MAALMLKHVFYPPVSHVPKLLKIDYAADVGHSVFWQALAYTSQIKMREAYCVV